MQRALKGAILYSSKGLCLYTLLGWMNFTKIHSLPLEFSRTPADK